MSETTKFCLSRGAEREVYRLGNPSEIYKCLRDGNLLFQGYPGLTYTRIFDNPMRYIRPLCDAHCDFLIIDLGTNDLCSLEGTPNCLVDYVFRFLSLLESNSCRFKRIVFRSVIQKSGVNTRRGQVDITTFNHRVKKYNRLLKVRLSASHPDVTDDSAKEG